MTDPNDDEHASPPPPALRVVVERSGGFAGTVRRWSVAAAADDARWRALVDACPWDRAASDRASAASAASANPASTGASGSSAAGADRFCWSVTAAHDAEERRAELAEHDVNGAWRELIDAVRDAQAAAGSPPEQ